MINSLKEGGFQIFDRLVDIDYIDKLNLVLEKSYNKARQIQVINGIDEVTDGTIHHLLAHNEPIYLELLRIFCDSEIYSFVKEFFHGNFILNSYGGLKNIPSKPSYVTNIHRDIRFFSGDFPLMLNLLIMLDDFTLENGATYLLAGSHKKDKRPDINEFYEKSDRAIGKKGNILFFNSNLWHAAGINNSPNERRAITITFSKPFMKQQFDYCRAIGYESIESMSIELQQIIGYFSRTPSSLHEWYQKPENRFYRPDQDK
jgi:ectoine hydroxylase-related dioxygenase (phytanoyl-CoA dioxygenase family)